MPPGMDTDQESLFGGSWARWSVKTQTPKKLPELNWFGQFTDDIRWHSWHAQCHLELSKTCHLPMCMHHFWVVLDAVPDAPVLLGSDRSTWRMCLHHFQVTWACQGWHLTPPRSDMACERTLEPAVSKVQGFFGGGVVCKAWFASLNSTKSSTDLGSLLRKNTSFDATLDGQPLSSQWERYLSSG